MGEELDSLGVCKVQLCPTIDGKMLKLLPRSKSFLPCERGKTLLEEYGEKGTFFSNFVGLGFFSLLLLIKELCRTSSDEEDDPSVSLPKEEKGHNFFSILIPLRMGRCKRCQ